MLACSEHRLIAFEAMQVLVLPKPPGPGQPVPAQGVDEPGSALAQCRELRPYITLQYAGSDKMKCVSSAN